jgi:bla regulator protein BlaR1
MPQALLNHLWQSTLFAAVAGLLTLALKENRAPVRYWLWFAASAKFLIPFSMLMTIGSHFEWRTAPAAAQPQFFSVVEEISQPVAPPAPSPRLENVPPVPSRGPAVLLAVWLCGLAVVAVAWARQWWRVRTALRTASPLHLNLPFRAMSSPARLEPGVFGVFRPVLLLPEGITQRLTPAQFDAILAHELCHVRRRDNLTAAIHMAVEAIFWFHPPVWWIGKRMVDERERACDEAVLLANANPQDYAEGILNVCKLYVESPLACVSGVTGSNLKKRIRAIMTERVARDLNFTKKLALSAVGIAALAGPIIVGVINAPPLRAQSPAQSAPTTAAPAPVKQPPAPQIVAQQSAPPQVVAQPVAQQAAAPKFEVASIRPCVPAPRGPGGRGGTGSPSPGRLSARCETLADLIRQAYATYADGLARNPYSLYVSIEGGPGWTKSDRYDINAEADVNATREMMNGPMLQALLEDRFKLKVHRETREVPVYALTVAKGGLRLQRREEGSCAPLPDPTNFRPGQKLDLSKTCGTVWFAKKREAPGSWTADMHGMSLDEFAKTLGRATDRPIVDKTGIAGLFDFHLEFSPDQTTPAFLPGGALLGNIPDPSRSPAAFADDPEGPSILTAMQEQLGLKLEPAKGPGEFLVIDTVEKPSDN